MTRIIRNHCRFRVLRLGAMRQLSVRILELCVAATWDQLGHGMHCCVGVCVPDKVPELRVGGGGRKPAAVCVV